MKFIIKDNPVSYDEIYQAIGSYMKDSHGRRPAYMIIHPETRRNVIVSSQDEATMIRYEVVQVRKHCEELKEVSTMFGVYIIQSEDVEPGFMILSG